MLKKPHGCTLLNFAGLTGCLEILQEVDNRHWVLVRESTVAHLHCGFLSHLIQLVRDVIVVPEILLNNHIVEVIYGVGKQFVHWLDNV